MALRDDVLKFYPSLAWAMDIPDVASKLEQAVKDQWTPDRLQAELQQTGWWQNTLPSARQWQEKQKIDPQSQVESIRQLNATLWDKSQSLGLNLPANVVDEISRQSIQFGWNDQQMIDAMIMKGSNQGVEGNAGAIGTAIAQLQTVASNYAVGLDNTTAYSWARAVAAGERKVEDFTPLMQQWAQSQFHYAPEIVNAIKAGVTVQEFLSPYRTEAAKILEISPDAVDITGNQQFAPIVDTIDKSGQRRMMTIPEMQTYLRGQDRWKQTRQGQEAAANMASTLTSMFGGTAS